MTSKITRRALLAASALPVLPSLAPRRARAAVPARFIVPFTAGGGTDGTARFMQQALSDHLGQTVVVENRAGGGTTLAANMVARSPGDGSVFMLVTIAHAVNPSLIPNLPYNAEKDLLPISMVTSAPMILVVHPSIPARSLQELIALAKTKPGTMNYSSPGNGSPAHLSGELLKSMANINLVHVPYKGSGPSISDLLSGQIHMTFASQVVILPFIKSGQVRAIAATTQHRSLALPDVPTIAESGIPNYSLISWQAVIAPGKTPPDVAQRLNTAVVACLNDPTVKKNLTAQGLEVTPSSLREANTFVTGELRRFNKLIKDMGIKADA